jgi:cytochrome c biogenesis protein CcdA
MSTRQMLYMMLGAVAGFLLGAVALLFVFRYFGPKFQDNGLYVLIVVAGLLVGGLTAGAYSVQTLIYRLEKARKRKARKPKKEKRRR